MNNEIIYEKAEKDYSNLCSVVKDFKGNLEELYSYLGGHNLEEDLFDVNFGCICATIVQKDNKLKILPNIEVWDDEKLECINSNYYIRI